jgi:hydroxymethylpyrimidine/phosphomethylpyrimidine kinase
VSPDSRPCDHGLGQRSRRGIRADLKTFSAHGIYGASVITAQNPRLVAALHEAPPDLGDTLHFEVSRVATAHTPSTGHMMPSAIAVLHAHGLSPKGAVSVSTGRAGGFQNRRR